MAHSPTDPIVAFAELGRIRFSETTMDDVLNRAAALARGSLGIGAEVSITLVLNHGPYTAAYTGDLALHLDELQYEQQSGPCLEAAARKAAVLVPDTATDERWAGWAHRAAEAGSGSVLSVGMEILDSVGGALNIYGRQPRAFDDQLAASARTFGGYAAAVLANAQEYHTATGLARHLQTAMETRAVIEQAKGIVMSERRCTAEEAFAVLTRASQNSNRKLREVAAALVESASTTGG
jgi:GAF domain-containing protein